MTAKRAYNPLKAREILLYSNYILQSKKYNRRSSLTKNMSKNRWRVIKPYVDTKTGLLTLKGFDLLKKDMLL